MKNLCIVIMCLYFSACTTIKPIAENANIDPRIYQECPSLPILDSSEDDIMLNHTKEIISLYSECRKWKKEENKILKQILNIK